MSCAARGPSVICGGGPDYILIYMYDVTCLRPHLLYRISSQSQNEEKDALRHMPHNSPYKIAFPHPETSKIYLNDFKRL